MVKFKLGKFSAMPKKRKRLIIAAIVVVAAGGLFWWQSAKAAPAVAESDYTEFTVARGNVTRTVSGPGAVSPVEIFTIATNLTGDILEDYFEEGDEVAKDALLFQVDEETASLDLDQVRSSMSSAQDSYNSSLRDAADLTTYAKQSGVVEALYVKKGEQVNSGTKVADIINTGQILITLPFNAADAAQMHAGEAAIVYLDDYDLPLEGYVQKVASGQNVSQSSALITNVEIVFANPGTLIPGGYGTAVVGDFACNNVGQTEYAHHDTVYAAGGGKITALYVGAGDRVSAGQKILSVENDSVSEAAQRAARNLEDAEKKFTNTQNNLQIKSPIAGTVLSKSAKAGDTLYNNSTTLAVVADMSRLTFTIDVDELEIRYLQAGQIATVTADAYEGETFEGIVTNVGKTGTASNGVTTYPVTIEIEEYGGLLPGMNVNADIIVEEAADVLYIPVDAVSRGNMVLVKAAEGETGAMAPGGSGQTQPGQGQPGEGMPAEGQLIMRDGENVTVTQGAGFMGMQPPAGFVYRQVETGISDKDYVEIKSGLEEGDIIAYKPSVDDSGMNNFMMMGPGGGMMMTTTSGPRPAGGGGNTVVRQGG